MYEHESAFGYLGDLWRQNSRIQSSSCSLLLQKEAVIISHQATLEKKIFLLICFDPVVIPNAKGTKFGAQNFLVLLFHITFVFRSFDFYVCHLEILICLYENTDWSKADKTLSDIIGISIIIMQIWRGFCFGLVLGCLVFFNFQKSSSWYNNN